MATRQRMLATLGNLFLAAAVSAQAGNDDPTGQRNCYQQSDRR